MNPPDTSAETEPNTPAGAPRQGAIIVLSVTAFLSTVGIGLANPVLPFIVAQHVSDRNALAATIGWLASLYAICQFLAAPALGAFSDRYGRRCGYYFWGALSTG